MKDGTSDEYLCSTFPVEEDEEDELDAGEEDEKSHLLIDCIAGVSNWCDRFVSMVRQMPRKN